MKRSILFFVIFLGVFSVHQQTFACSPVQIPTLVSQAIVGNNLNLSWSSNTIYNCTYYIQVEIVCNGSTFPGTGNPPFYQSSTITKTSTPFPYPLQAINIGNLCPGTVYQFRAREVYSVSPTIFSGWTATFTFTTPGTFVQPTVTVTASPNSICTPQTSQLLCTIQNGCGPTAPTYSWVPAATLNNATIANPTASPTTTTTYTCYVTGGLQGCWTANGSVTITTTVPPIAGTASVAPSTICAGSTVTLTLTGYTGTIQWQSGPTSTGPWTNIVGATTTPYVTGPINANTCFQAIVSGCGNVTSNAVCVTVNPSPTANAGANVSICLGNSTTLNGSGGGTYSWSPAASLSNNTIANPVATPTATTTYTVTVTQSGCSSTAQVTVTVNPLPTISIVPANPSICAGGNINLTASGGSVYNWSPATGLNATTGATVNASPSATTTYTVSATDANGCPGTATVTVTVSQNVNIVSCADTICQGGSIALCCLFPNNITNYLWSPSGSLSSPSVSNPTATPTVTTTYTVIATNNAGCTGSGTSTITVSPTITLAMAGFPETCPGSCDGQAVCIPNGGMGGPFFLWSNAGTAASISPICPGTYTVVVTDGVGCTATGTANVAAVAPFVLSSATNPSNCNLPNGDATINAAGGTPGYTYVWNPGGQTTQTATGLLGGNYTVTVTDANGCTSSLAVTVPSNPAVTASVPSSTNISCFGACDGTANSQAGSGTAPYTYSWSNGQTTQNVTGLCPGTYTVTITDNIGCMDTATVTITQPTQLTVATAVSGPICLGQNATITGTPNGGTPGYSYAWAPSGGNGSSATVSPTTTTTYTVTVTDQNACTALNMITVVVNPLPVVSFTGIDTSGCAPLTVTFTNNTANSTNCSWTFGDNGTSTSCGNPVVYTYTTPGVYSVTLAVVDNNGCASAATHTNMVTVFSNPVSCFSFGPQPTTVLNPIISFSDCSTGANSWYWNFGDVANSTSALQNPTFTYPDTGLFVVQQKVCNSNGCCDSSQQTVVIGPDFTFFVPNAFTPGGGDGHNEEFFPVGTGLDLSTYHMWIWDRWGNMIFETDNWSRHWDGKVNGKDEIVQEDVYVWKIRINDFTGKKHEYVGHVSIIK